MKRAAGISRAAYEAEREFEALVRRRRLEVLQDDEIESRQVRRVVLALVALSLIVALLASVITGRF